MNEILPNVRANSALRDIWRKHWRECAIHREIFVRDTGYLWPLQYTEMQPGRVLFVGLNPSYDEEDAGLLNVGTDFDTDRRLDFRVAQILLRGQFNRGIPDGNLHSYFRYFKEFSPDQTWNHIDLIAVRQTRQTVLAKTLGLESRDATQFKPFVTEQMKVCRDLAQALTPPVIVIVNALAADIVKRYLEESAALVYDSDKGYHRAKLGAKRIPIFFSGMLTGQRALDTHSRSRLIWHVRQALIDMDRK
jgi:hypothetical protein